MSTRSARWGARLLRTRPLVQAPILLYRARLGLLLGHRLLMLEHRGRTTGLARYVVLEVVDRPAPDTYVVVSGFGERSQWYRNVVATPAVHVSVGTRRRVPAQAVVLADAEADAALASYAARHPRTWEWLRATMQAALGRPVDRFTTVRLTLAPHRC